MITLFPKQTQWNRTGRYLHDKGVLWKPKCWSLQKGWVVWLVWNCGYVISNVGEMWLLLKIFFAANYGGLWGIFMGASFISFVENVYFSTIKFYGNFQIYKLILGNQERPKM